MKNSEIEGGVSITLVPSNSSDIIFEYKALAPNWRLWDNFKKKKISEDKFIVEYNNMLKDLNPKHVLEHLHFLTGGIEPILMCKPAKTKFCHRHLVADWLENEEATIPVKIAAMQTPRKPVNEEINQPISVRGSMFP